MMHTDPSLWIPPGSHCLPKLWSCGSSFPKTPMRCARNDEKKLHPGIVPYEELSESEKDYDRRTAEETLKLILALGFEIRKQGE